MAVSARARTIPWCAALALLVGCAVGEPGTNFSTSFGGTGMPTDGTGQATGGPSDTEGPQTGGVMTGAATGDTGSDPDTGGTGVDPDTGDSGPDPDTGPSCVPEAEICDGMDNDCDGTPDNGDPEGGMPCDTGMPGECADGETACEGGTVVCNPLGMAMGELCNGLDDDCDGTVDNGNPEGGGGCSTGMPGICSAGTEACQSGSLVCQANMSPGVESCNGLDDDCDGATDEGNPGGGAACMTGLPGICAAGTMTCTGGALSCVQNNAPVAEICGNALDDDCDGTVDDGCPCPFGLCETPGMPMINGCDPCVTMVCAVDAFCCSSQWDSICVGEVETVCMQADCVSSACAHLVCDTGVALTSGCHQCVTDICAADPFCCSNSWDGLCVGAVATVCGLTCP